MSRFDPLAVANAEVPRSHRLDRVYEVLSRPYLGRIIDTPTALAAFQAQILQAQNKTSRTEPSTAIAYVNWGRWMIDCFCGDAPMCDPDWPAAHCLLCGRVWLNITYPAFVQGIENALLKRPDAPNRNWRPGETVADLLAENAAHGIL